MTTDAATEPTDQRRARGRRTRASILETAVDIASIDGLSGLTIGRLAGELGMSKSGLFAHFGSKEELQLATNAAARDRFRARVIDRALARPAGRERLETLVREWLDHMRERVFPGGCFFTSVRAEFDSREPGPVRDVVAEDHRRWLAFLARTIAEAQAAGEAAAGDPEQLAYEVEALGIAANLAFQLHGDPVAFTRAETAIGTRLWPGWAQA